MLKRLYFALTAQLTFFPACSNLKKSSADLMDLALKNQLPKNLDSPSQTSNTSDKHAVEATPFTEEVSGLISCLAHVHDRLKTQDICRRQMDLAIKIGRLCEDTFTKRFKVLCCSFKLANVFFCKNWLVDLYSGKTNLFLCNILFLFASHI